MPTIAAFVVSVGKLRSFTALQGAHAKIVLLLKGRMMFSIPLTLISLFFIRRRRNKARLAAGAGS
jgi:hypothetical protein